MHVRVRGADGAEAAGVVGALAAVDADGNVLVREAGGAGTPARLVLLPAARVVAVDVVG